MNIPTEYSKEVLEDLAVLYLAGEATPGTRAFVEDCARKDLEFAQRLKQSGTLDLKPPKPAATHDSGAEALRQTRRFVSLRTIFTALGIAFTLLPLSFTFDSQGVRMLFFNSQPGLVQAFWSMAAASWVATALMHRRIRARGL